MNVPGWLETFLQAPWYEKLFWLFFAGVAAFIAITWLRMLFDRPLSTKGPRAKSGGIGSVTIDAGGTSFDSFSSDTSASFDSGSSDSGGSGSNFSGGGGDSGGGGASGGW